MVSASSLAGSYRLIFVGTSGEARGKRADGELVLMPRPPGLRPVLALDLTPMPGVSEPLYGSTTIDLAAVGGYVRGSVESMDPSAPGVVIRIAEYGDRHDVSLRFGAEENSRAVYMLDGPILEAPVLEVSDAGFAGRWEASVGPTTYHAGGFFCAIRTNGEL